MTRADELERGKKYPIRELHALSPRTESSTPTSILVFAWASGSKIGAFSDSVLSVVWGDFPESEIVIPEEKGAIATLRLRPQDVNIYLHSESLPVEALVSGNPNARIKPGAMILAGGIGGNIVR